MCNPAIFESDVRMGMESCKRRQFIEIQMFPHWSPLLGYYFPGNAALILAPGVVSVVKPGF